VEEERLLLLRALASLIQTWPDRPPGHGMSVPAEDGWGRQDVFAWMKESEYNKLDSSACLCPPPPTHPPTHHQQYQYQTSGASAARRVRGAESHHPSFIHIYIASLNHDDP
jgi:hypothetical protein